MASVLYNSQKIIPAPLINIQQSWDKTPDGTVLGTVYNITLNGTLVAGKGSPAPTGFYTGGGYPPDDAALSVDAKFKALLRKQEQLRNLFKTELQWFEVQPTDGSAPLKFKPRINSISFPDGIWVEQCPYVVEMETDILYLSNLPGSGLSNLAFPQALKSISEGWSLEYQQENDSFTLSHALSAQGKFGPSGIPAWKEAKDWVQSRLGIDSDRKNSLGIYNSTDYEAYNLIRTEQVDIYEGNYTVNENWTLARQNYTHEFTVSQEFSPDRPDVVSIQGTIQGLVKPSGNLLQGSGFVSPLIPLPMSGKYDNALVAWNTISSGIYSTALTYSSVTLNTVPLSYTVSRNKNVGSIDYNYTYDTRSQNCIPDSRFENIVINDDYDSDVVAIIPVISRPAGPVIQAINTKTEKVRTLTIEVVMATSGESCTTKLANINSRPYYSGVIDAVRPVANQVYVTSDQETWDISSKRGSRVVTWLYQ